MKRVTAFLGAVLACGSATAGIDLNPYVTEGADSAILDAAGYTDVANGASLLIEPTQCEGCYSFPSLDGPLSLQGYVRLDFQVASDYLWMGYNVLMSFDFGGTGWSGVQEMIDFLNGTDMGGVTAMDLASTSNPICYWPDINGFIDNGYTVDNTIVFRWGDEDTPPPPGTTISTTFAWDFTDLASGNPGFGESGFITGVGATPAPGAVALLGVVGLFGRSRRR